MVFTRTIFAIFEKILKIVRGNDSYCFESKTQKWFLGLKGYEFNNNTLSNAVACFFHIFVIVLLVQCEKKRVTMFDRELLLNSYHFRERSLMTSLIRVGRGVQDSPQKGKL